MEIDIIVNLYSGLKESLLVNEVVKILSNNGTRSANYFCLFEQKTDGSTLSERGIFGFNYYDDTAMVMIFGDSAEKDGSWNILEGRKNDLRGIEEVYVGRIDKENGEMEFIPEVVIFKNESGSYELLN